MSTQFRDKSEEDQIQESFQFFDREKNGVITRKELINTFSSSRELSEEYIKSVVEIIFDKVDTNKNGTIEYKEFLHANLNWAQILTSQNIKIIFDFLDVVIQSLYIYIYIGE